MHTGINYRLLAVIASEFFYFILFIYFIGFVVEILQLSLLYIFLQTIKVGFFFRCQKFSEIQ